MQCHDGIEKMEAKEMYGEYCKSLTYKNLSVEFQVEIWRFAWTTFYKATSISSVVSISALLKGV